MTDDEYDEYEDDISEDELPFRFASPLAIVQYLHIHEDDLDYPDQPTRVITVSACPHLDELAARPIYAISIPSRVSSADAGQQVIDLLLEGGYLSHNSLVIAAPSVQVAGWYAQAIVDAYSSRHMDLTRQIEIDKLERLWNLS